MHYCQGLVRVWPNIVSFIWMCSTTKQRHWVLYFQNGSLHMVNSCKTRKNWHGILHVLGHVTCPGRGWGAQGCPPPSEDKSQWSFWGQRCGSVSCSIHDAFVVLSVSCYLKFPLFYFFSFKFYSSQVCYWRIESGAEFYFVRTSFQSQQCNMLHQRTGHAALKESDLGFYYFIRFVVFKFYCT